MSTSNYALLYPLKPSHSAPIPISQFFTLGENSLGLLNQNKDVAERHARIELRYDGYWLRDLRSGLPTYLNDQAITESRIQENDEIAIGSLRFLFSHQGSESKIDPELMSKNENWQMQLAHLPKVANTSFPVLILGPSGSGKEILAQKIHQLSARNDGPLVSVNCCALSENLIESELFGHVKGSFTGAINDRKGAFETARGGTLFLDEIGDLPYSLQAKLLRALENNEIRPVGSDRNIKTDVRIVAATHQNLNEKIRLNMFRSDLYFRLNVLTLTPPSLADRMEDFEDLLFHFCKEFKVSFSFAATQKLKHHRWPGNIRELKNTVARAAALFQSQLVEENHLSFILDSAGITSPDGQKHMPGDLSLIKEIERDMIIKKLIKNNGNQRQTATELGVPKSTLHDRIKSYKIDPTQYRLSNALGR